MPFYIFHGNDIKLLRREIGLFERNILTQHPETEIYSPDFPDISLILEKISSGSLFASKELIKLYDFEKITGIEKIFEYPNEDFYIFLLSYNEKISKKLLKDRDIHLKTFNLPKSYQLETIIGHQFKDRLSYEVIDYLSKNIISIIDLDELHDTMEREKINYLDLDGIVKLKGDTEAKIFLIIDDVLNKKIGPAILQIHDFLNSDGYIGQLTGALSAGLARLYQIKILKKAEKTNKEIASELKIHPFIVKKLLTTASFYSIVDLERLLCDLPQMIFDIRSHGPLFSQYFVEKFIFGMKGAPS